MKIELNIGNHFKILELYHAVQLLHNVFKWGLKLGVLKNNLLSSHWSKESSVRIHESLEYIFKYISLRPHSEPLYKYTTTERQHAMVIFS